MTDDPRRPHDPDDAKLLNQVRAGDASAFAVLTRRHEQAARLLAGELASTRAGDLVAQTMARVLAVTQRGGGPTDAFRPYLLTAVHGCWKGQDEGDPGALFLTPGAESPLLAQALAGLPARWIAVLWHTEIEVSSAAEVATMLGLSENGVMTLRRHAKDGLRQAYLQLYSDRQAQCAAVTARLGAFLRDAGSGSESAIVTEHLSQCDECRAAYTELADVSLALQAVVAPLFLGEAAAAYLSAAGRGAPPAAADVTTAASAALATAAAPAAATALIAAPAPAAAPAAAAPATAAPATAAPATAAPGKAWISLPDQLSRASRPLRWLAIGGAAAVAICAIAFAVTVSSQDTQGAAPVHQSAPDGPSVTARLTPIPSVRPVAVTHRKHRHKKRPAAPLPAPVSSSTSPAPPAVALAASVNVSSQGRFGGSIVSFAVSDTGSAATGPVTVSITLPAGSTVFGGHGGFDHGPGHGGFGDWSCQPSSTGATCEHEQVSPGTQAQGTLFVMIVSSTACGQGVGLTATSGSASVSAESPETLKC